MISRTDPLPSTPWRKLSSHLTLFKCSSNTWTVKHTHSQRREWRNRGARCRCVTPPSPAWPRPSLPARGMWRCVKIGWGGDVCEHAGGRRSTAEAKPLVCRVCRTKGRERKCQNTTSETELHCVGQAGQAGQDCQWKRGTVPMVTDSRTPFVTARACLCGECLGLGSSLRLSSFCCCSPHLSSPRLSSLRLSSLCCSSLRLVEYQGSQKCHSDIQPRWIFI